MQHQLKGMSQRLFIFACANKGKGIVADSSTQIFSLKTHAQLYPESCYSLPQRLCAVHYADLVDIINS